MTPRAVLPVTYHFAALNEGSFLRIESFGRRNVEHHLLICFITLLRIKCWKFPEAGTGCEAPTWLLLTEPSPKLHNFLRRTREKAFLSALYKALVYQIGV